MKLDAIRNNKGIWINTSVFREEGEFFKRNGYYCSDPWGSPSWYEYWKEQRRRCIEGYEVAGARITGDHYFYLNFCPIMKVDDSSSKTSKKIKGFPDFWDGDYNYFWVREIARYGLLDYLTLDQRYNFDLLSDLEQVEVLKKMYNDLHLIVKIPSHTIIKSRKKDVEDIFKHNLKGGFNLIVGKSRRKGYSYKAGAIAAKNFYFKLDSMTIFGAYDKKYLYPNGIFSMSMRYINFINSNTAFQTPSDVVNKPNAGHIKASYIQYKNGIKSEEGLMSEIMALSFKDNPDAARGKDADEVFFEESGAFGTPGLLKKSYAATQDVVLAGEIKTGMITIFGCVCKGTKVWDNKGILRNIEDINKETGIIGYASKGVIEENISWLKPPAKKECVKITTDKGESIECSIDHPLLWSHKKYFNYKTNKKKATFKEAKNIKVGDYLLQCLQMPKFGDKAMWQPRLVGLLIGDGYYGGKSSSAELCIAEKELWDYINTIGIPYTERIKKSSEKPFFKYINFKGTQKQMRLLGLQGQSKGRKRLPANIWDYNKESVSEMLGGYFDADGYVGSVGNRKKISLTSVVRPLLEEVQIQLYKFGVQSTIYTRKHKKGVELKSNITGRTTIINTEISYSLEICDLESIRNFKKHIKLLVKKKQSLIDSWNLDRRKNERILEYEYEHTIEKGNYFISNNKLENLRARKVVSVEFIGEQDIYNLTADYTHTYLTNNFISHNTSGDMEGGTADYADMMMRPEAFGLLPFYNIWDENSEQQKVGFFHPVNWNMEGYYDEQGNSDYIAARKAEEKNRENLINSGATSTEIQQRMQEKPFGPSEAFATSSVNNFPVVELRKQLKRIQIEELDKKRGTPVKLFYDGNVVKDKPILDGSVSPIDSYLNVPTNKKGCIIVYERPVSDAPRGLYKIGYDPVRQDEGTSLAAIIVYKGVHKSTTYHSNIVATYVGRLDSTDDLDEIALMLADYYNTQIMHENEVTGVKNYFRRKKRLDALAMQPDQVISSNIKKSRVSRTYGCHMTTALKDAGERYIKEWLLTIIDYDENQKPIRALDRIYSKRLLEELINYNRDGNFDLVSALFMCMFQVQDETLGKVYSKNNKNKNAENLLKMMKDMYIK